MNKIKRIYVKEIGWINHKIQTVFGTEEEWADNGEIMEIHSNTGKIIFLKQKSTFYPKDHILAIEYY